MLEAKYLANHARGERQGSAKLTEESVIQIRRLYAEGAALAALAREFGVTPQTIASVLGIGAGRKTWRHVK